MFLGHRLRSPRPDAIASVAIGVMMAAVACLLAWASRGLLVGETAALRVVEDMCRLASADPDVVRVDRPLTLQLGPREVLLTLDVQFRPGMAVRELEATIDRLEANIRRHHPGVKRIFIEAESLGKAGGRADRPNPSS